MERPFAGTVQAHDADSVCAAAANVLSRGEWQLGRGNHVYATGDRRLLRGPQSDGVGVSTLSYRTSEQRNYALRLPEWAVRGDVQGSGTHATRAFVLCEYMCRGVEPGRRSFR